ncbi:lytic transglycosylase domain-containing protein [Salinibius halmophilus]|uniref:lytic transglycosylase domain-containing protein n=1 Tax=Salinibius halmophilus TaxID=1853216 RepID=UPI0018F67BB7|nr:lytic transglycosylase domain-containing protein [Salinibius halmophilus]
MMSRTVFFFVLLLFTGLVHASQPDSARSNQALIEALSNAVQDSSSFPDKYDAMVWYADMSGRLQRYKYMRDHEERLEFLRLVHAEAARVELPAELILSVIHVESLFDQYAVSRAGALGLMQIMPFWLEELGRPDDNLFDVATNLRYGTTILKHYLEIEDGDLTRALARYNGSLGKTWYPERVMDRWDRFWQY